MPPEQLAPALLGQTLVRVLAGVRLVCEREPRRLRALAPECRIGLLISKQYPVKIVERARALGAEAIHPEAVLVDAALVEAAHDAGLAVYVFTVDAQEEMERLLALGVDGLFTNHPDRMRRLVDAAL